MTDPLIEIKIIASGAQFHIELFVNGEWAGTNSRSTKDAATLRQKIIKVFEIFGCYNWPWKRYFENEDENEN